MPPPPRRPRRRQAPELSAGPQCPPRHFGFGPALPPYSPQRHRQAARPPLRPLASPLLAAAAAARWLAVGVGAVAPQQQLQVAAGPGAEGAARPRWGAAAGGSLRPARRPPRVAASAAAPRPPARTPARTSNTVPAASKASPALPRAQPMVDARRAGGGIRRVGAHLGQQPGRAPVQLVPRPERGERVGAVPQRAHHLDRARRRRQVQRREARRVGGRHVGAVRDEQARGPAQVPAGHTQHPRHRERSVTIHLARHAPVPRHSGRSQLAVG